MTRDVLLRTEQLARIGSWSWEPDSGRTTWSPGMYRHYGLTPDESVFADRDRYFEAIHAEDLPDFGSTCLARRGSERLDPIEYRVGSGEASATIGPKARSIGIRRRDRFGWWGSFRT